MYNLVCLHPCFGKLTLWCVALAENFVWRKLFTSLTSARTYYSTMFTRNARAVYATPKAWAKQCKRYTASCTFLTLQLECYLMTHNRGPPFLFCLSIPFFSPSLSHIPPFLHFPILKRVWGLWIAMSCPSEVWSGTSAANARFVYFKTGKSWRLTRKILICNFTVLAKLRGDLQ